MKIRTLLALVIASFLAAACVKDDTTWGTGAISVITIDSTSIATDYNIKKNDLLVIQPVISQTKDQPVKYTWEMDLKPVSSQPVFEYEAKELGTFRCRLIVENNDGKSFFNFTINVNTPYEEGLTLISQDKQGKGKLSFLLFSPKGEPQGSFTTEDCFAVNNPDEKFVARPVDIVQSGNTLMMACQGDETKGEPGTIYYLNDKTLVVENIITAPEYPDFKPVRMAIPSVGATGVAYPILCENGRIYEFSASEGALVKPKKLPYTYSSSFIVYDNGSAYNNNLIFWEKEAKGLCQVMSNYGPYFCTKDYEKKERKDFLKFSAADPNVNYFYGKDFVKMELIRMTPEQAVTNPSEFLVLTSGFVNLKVRMQTAFWMYNFDEEKNYLMDNGGFTPIGVGTLPLNEHTPSIANFTYKSMLFADGNKVRRWNYTSSQQPQAADVLLTVGTPSSVITCFEMSADHKITYVAFYDPQQEGSNGSVWAFDTDKGTVINRYDNICYQPTKLIYKKK